MPPKVRRRYMRKKDGHGDAVPKRTRTRRSIRDCAEIGRSMLRPYKKAAKMPPKGPAALHAEAVRLWRERGLRRVREPREGFGLWGRADQP